MISIIVPVLNEVAIVGAALETLLRQAGDYEVIVVDGGSDDGTCDVALPWTAGGSRHILAARQRQGVNQPSIDTTGSSH